MPTDDEPQAAEEHPEETPIEDVEDEGEVPFKYSITSYGADYPVDGLVKRMEGNSVFIPRFQRDFVWDLKRGSRFIESLLLGLPVPGIFLSKEERTQKLLVIDGQQRLRTLQYFYRGVFADSTRVFALKGVQTRFEGMTYRSLPDEDRRRLDDSILHATIVKQDEPSEDESSIYHIFERLNTGGVLLQPQEIRACIYHGAFQEELKHLNGNPAWRSVYGPVSPRMKDQELILRFLALFLEGDEYTKPMKGFLNTFMAKNKDLTAYSAATLEDTFRAPIELIDRCLGVQAFRPRRNFIAAVFDSVMVGIARRLKGGPVRSDEDFVGKYTALISEEEFRGAAETGTSSEDKVRKRIDLATTAFADVV
jgi:hypothetical protein